MDINVKNLVKNLLIQTNSYKMNFNKRKKKNEIKFKTKQKTLLIK